MERAVEKNATQPVESCGGLSTKVVDAGVDYSKNELPQIRGAGA